MASPPADILGKFPVTVPKTDKSWAWKSEVMDRDEDLEKEYRANGPLKTLFHSILDVVSMVPKIVNDEEYASKILEECIQARDHDFSDKSTYAESEFIREQLKIIIDFIKALVKG